MQSCAMFVFETCEVSDNVKGASLFLLQQACIVSNDTIMKMASQKTSLFQALLIRGGYVTILLTLLAWRCDQLQLPVPPSDRKILLGRCVCEFCANCFYLTGLFHMPLANATAISQFGPLAVTFAAAVCLREAVEPRHWVMLTLSFCGVLIIIRPGYDGFNAYSLLILLAVVSGCIRDLASRSFSVDTPSIKVALASGITNFLLGGWLSLATWDSQARIGREALLWACAGLFMGTSQLCMVVGMRVGSTGIVQQFRFVGILFAVLAGYCAFGEVPDMPAASGCIFVLSAGVYSLVVSLRAQPPAKNVERQECKPNSYGRCQSMGRDSDGGCVPIENPDLCERRQTNSEEKTST